MRIAFTLGAAKKVGLAVLVTFGALSTSTSAGAAEPPRVPEQVADYFATGLIPRLADLYAPGADSGSGIDFDDTTTVGTISRVLVWTDDFRAGESSEPPVQLTNDWVAPITVGDGENVGLATVWISPHTDLPELANFVPSATLGPALAEAPEGSLLVHDDEWGAWFALVDDKLIPLVAGDTGITRVSLSIDQARDALLRAPVPEPGPLENRGFALAGLTLGFVVVMFALFVLMPDRRRGRTDADVEFGFPPRPDAQRPSQDAAKAPTRAESVR